MRRGSVAATRSSLAGLLIVLAGAAALTPVADSDIWWHLAAGREMIARRGFLWADPFSLGARGRPWIDLHWLFQLGSYTLFRLGGLAALVGGKVVLVAAGAWLWLRAIGQSLLTDADPDAEESACGRARIAASAVLAVALPLGLFFVRHLLLVRPVILTLVFLAAFVLVLERFATTGRGWVLIWLPALTMVWANCQGLWPLGILTAACALGGDAIAWLWDRLARGSTARPWPRQLPAGGPRRLGAAVLACVLAGTLTPYGWRALVLPVKLLLRLVPANANVFSSQVAENVPPWLLARGDPWALLPLLIVAVLTAASFAYAPRDRLLGRALVVLAFFGLALTANRNVLLFFWMAIPIATANASPYLAARSRPGARAASPVSASARRLLGLAWGLATATTAGLLVFALVRETRLDQPVPFRVPAGSARVIGDDPGQGRVFCADHYGGYIIWALHPRAAPYIDTRLVLRTADEYAEFLALLEDPDRWEDFSGRHPFDYAALPTDYPDRYLPLAAHLYRSRDWGLVYTDGTESLFRHDPGHRHPAIDLASRATTDGILAEQSQRYPRPEVAAAARRQLARLDLALGHPEECLYVLSALSADPIALAVTGRCHLQIGDFTAAESTGHRLLELDADSVAGLDLLALASLARGDLAAAIGWLRKALTADPYDPESRAILDQLESRSAGQPAAPAKPR